MAILGSTRRFGDAKKKTNRVGNKVTFNLKIYELQRRSALHVKDWRAPFLPHDRLRKHAWRWVDLAFHTHPWMSAGSIQQAAAAETPPITPGDNWVAVGDWKVDIADDTDQDGWQYANNYYRFNSLWGSVARGCLVRRRLWTCDFVEQEMPSSLSHFSKDAGPLSSLEQRPEGSSGFHRADTAPVSGRSPGPQAFRSAAPERVGQFHHASSYT